MTSPPRRLLAAALLCAAATLPIAATATGAAVPKKPVGCLDENLIPTAGNLARINTATLCLVNKERTKRGLLTLKRQATLSRVATAFAAQLVRERFFSHVAPNGASALDRVRRSGYLVGYRKWSVGENIAAGTGTLSTPKATLKAWMNSPGHRANILKRTFRDIGLGVHMGTAKGKLGATYAHEFGQRSR
jgi:uncharacterized protein YkwD